MKIFKRRKLIIAFTLLATLVFATGAFAQEAEVAEEIAGIQDQFTLIWLFVSAVLVFFMQAGFAMVESGFSRAKNAANLIMKNIMDFSLGALLFFAVGFGFMYGESAGGFIGTSNFFLSNFTISDMVGYDWVDFMFQLMFAAAAATIVSGAVAERLKFNAYFVYSIIMIAFIYPISGHWHWGGGWVLELGFIDFAGSTVVHAVGGFAALAAAIVLGPRIGKFNKDGSANVIPGHSLTLAALGVFILWMGWYGFNAGSTLDGNSTAIAYIGVTTTLSAAAAVVSALFINWFKTGKPSTEMALNGALAGLVSITAGTANVTPVGAIIIGLIGGAVLVFGLDLVEKMLKVDDPVGAVAVHGFAGVWGTIAVGLFASADAGIFTGMGDATTNGLLNGGGTSLLVAQLIGTVAISAWAFVTMFITFSIMKATMGVRVSAQEELEGLDLSEHGTVSYPEFGGDAATVVASAD